MLNIRCKVKMISLNVLSYSYTLYEMTAQLPKINIILIAENKLQVQRPVQPIKYKIIIKKCLIDAERKQIVDIFNANVKNKKILLDNMSEGHWLEMHMGIKPNCDNKPDILGYEMKKEAPKISFGDFSASEYLFSLYKPLIDQFNGWSQQANKVNITRNEFIQYFGHSNIKKNGRYSWSGSCVPKYGKWNTYGQLMEFNSNDDLCIYYSFEMDNRQDKNRLPTFLRTNNRILIVIWKRDKLSTHIDRKFNNKGFFICKKIGNCGIYNKICFGKPFSFSYFVENMKKGTIIFDSGMHMDNSRNYSHFRSPLNFWNLLITEEY